MAVVILGGFITSTLLNLFLPPTVYLRFGRPDAGLPTPGNRRGRWRERPRLIAGQRVMASRKRQEASATSARP